MKDPLPARHIVKDPLPAPHTHLCFFPLPPPTPQIGKDKYGVSVLAGSRTGDHAFLSSYMRLSYSYYEPAHVEPAVLRLRSAVLEARHVGSPGARDAL